MAKKKFVEATFKQLKKTANTFCFEEQTKDELQKEKIGRLYIQKAVLPEKPPEKIKAVIKKA